MCGFVRPGKRPIPACRWCMAERRDRFWVFRGRVTKFRDSPSHELGRNSCHKWKSHIPRKGTALAVPERAIAIQGITGCGKTPRATTSPYPRTGAPCSPRRTWAEYDGRSPPMLSLNESHRALIQSRVFQQHVSHSALSPSSMPHCAASSEGFSRTINATCGVFYSPALASQGPHSPQWSRSANQSRTTPVHKDAEQSCE